MNRLWVQIGRRILNCSFPALVILAILSTDCPIAFSFVNPEAEFSQWVSQDTPENRAAIARWSEDFLRSTLSFKDSQYLQRRPITVGWRARKGIMAEAFYDPKQESPFQVKLSATHWFKDGQKDGTASWDVLAFSLLHERYHMFCRTYGDDMTGAKQLMPVLQKMREKMGNQPLAPHSLTHLATVVHTIEEFQANAYAKKEYERVVGFQGLEAMRKIHKFNIGFTNDWSEAIVAVPPWQAYAMNEISKRLGFDSQYIQGDLDQPEIFNRMAQNMGAMPTSEGCQWLKNACETVASDPAVCLPK